MTDLSSVVVGFCGEPKGEPHFFTFVFLLSFVLSWKGTTQAQNRTTTPERRTSKAGRTAKTKEERRNRAKAAGETQAQRKGTRQPQRTGGQPKPTRRRDQDGTGAPKPTPRRPRSPQEAAAGETKRTKNRERTKNERAKSGATAAKKTSKEAKGKAPATATTATRAADGTGARKRASNSRTESQKAAKPPKAQRRTNNGKREAKEAKQQQKRKANKGNTPKRKNLLFLFALLGRESQGCKARTFPPALDFSRPKVLCLSFIFGGVSPCGFCLVCFCPQFARVGFLRLLVGDLSFGRLRLFGGHFSTFPLGHIFYSRPRHVVLAAAEFIANASALPRAFAFRLYYCDAFKREHCIYSRCPRTRAGTAEFSYH